MELKNCKFESISKINFDTIIDVRSPKEFNEDHIPNFTGISDPFEEPTQSDLVLQTDELSLKQAAAKLEKYILKQIK